MMPGPPREMKAMMQESILPYLMKSADHTLVSRNIHIFGLGESFVEDRLHEMMEAAKNPTIAPYAKEGEVLLRVTASVRDKADADRLIDPVIEKIRAEIGDAIYGIDVDNLQNALVGVLKAKGLTVATARELHRPASSPAGSPRSPAPPTYSGLGSPPTQMKRR